MKVLYLGDVVGRPGRDVVIERLPEIRERLAPDFIVVNGENSAGGFGMTEKIAEEFFAAGTDCIVLGNHSFDQKEIMPVLERDGRILRPANYPKDTPGKGIGAFKTRRGKTILVIQLMGRLFMDPLDDPFAMIEQQLSGNPLGRKYDFILVDLHAEATSEKMAMGQFCDGRVSMVVGSHTHVPTADTQILPKGTAYQTDAGMCGDYDSVIGMDKEEPLRRFIRKIPAGRFTPAAGPGTACGVFVVSDDKTGLATYVSPLRIGGRLMEIWPSVT
ncbi:MAG: TIGR00282 family metallophosphoesterase [Sneathiella sp.]|uniref:TIGR00282 family metallophosphoesterase n=1 Tax=Sneathiella sp. TaxID=1964365 RepID=UPI000C5407EB|nr:TIGR00282 family metallophosphoesterase [Sneathiella sp.]MAL78074.1 TIGR00282 family metallophosphoesterase [Sneathiella sp.]